MSKARRCEECGEQCKACMERKYARFQRELVAKQDRERERTLEEQQMADMIYRVYRPYVYALAESVTGESETSNNHD